MQSATFKSWADRTRHTNDHHGLGLSIVRAIADAHDATLNTRPQPQGGLQIEITFPAMRMRQLELAPTD